MLGGCGRWVVQGPGAFAVRVLMPLSLQQFGQIYTSTIVGAFPCNAAV
jgi:hypothetical protein